MLSIPFWKKCQLKKDAWLFGGQIFEASDSHVSLGLGELGANGAPPERQQSIRPLPSQPLPLVRQSVQQALVPHNSWARFACTWIKNIKGTLEAILGRSGGFEAESVGELHYLIQNNRLQAWQS